MNKSMRGMSAASRRSLNNTGNARDRYQANYPGGDPDFDRFDQS